MARKAKKVTRSFEMETGLVMMINLDTREVKEVTVDVIKGDDLLAAAEAAMPGYKSVTVLKSETREEIRMMSDTTFFNNSVVYER